MAVCLSHGGTTTTISNSPSAELLVGTVDGVFRIHRKNSNTWRTSREGLEGMHIHALLIEPSSGWVFAGVHKGSIFVGQDSCTNWESRNTGLTEKDVYSLNIHVMGDKVKLYAGTEPAHLFESDNLGKAWQEIPSLRSVPSVSRWTFPAPPHIAHVKNIDFHPTAPETIYVCVEQGGLLKSDDAGLTWRELHGFDEGITFHLPEGAFPDDVHRLVIPPSHPEWLYLSGGIGLSRSKDGGQTWQHLTTPETDIGYPDALLSHPQREGLLFMAGAKDNPRKWRETHRAESGIARSRDGGESWELLGNGLPEHSRGNIEAMSMELYDDTFSLFAGTTDGDIFCSEDEGESWAKIAQDLPAISKGGHYLRLR